MGAVRCSWRRCSLIPLKVSFWHGTADFRAAAISSGIWRTNGRWADVAARTVLDPQPSWPKSTRCDAARLQSSDVAVSSAVRVPADVLISINHVLFGRMHACLRGNLM